ncbi:expressed hypothetical protein [Trichoplax adhaerens]|uniref:Cytosol aminopeptidase domain-containing protein n=1 Tax=Trichoplax adhaerens TaxID=10228 RepID=B3S3I0_TRIAD|nr:expressed hypothetical protein [Trichoplax adhaerens]EDV22797.1 expressed hypothetical protein [Trichoplax adhaerens]|eukprot:XP_002114663.1 expressed hypothetical protein [Trichoplax adhaerens]
MSANDAYLPCQVTAVSDPFDANYSCIVLVATSIDAIDDSWTQIKGALQSRSKIDASFNSGTHILEVTNRALIYAPTGPLNRDYDDVRRITDAAKAGINRASKAESKRPLLILPSETPFPHSFESGVLGALSAAYVPLELREARQTRYIEELGVFVRNENEKSLIPFLSAIESGRLVCRDIGGSDPERMAPPNAANYVQDVFKDTPVKVQVISDVETIGKEYPLFAAVNRCSETVPRHNGRIVYLEYNGEGTPDETLLLVGKGVTMDTGGADLKVGGAMRGMNRDKCGAATVAGFFQILARFRPKNIRVLGGLALVRNSIGTDCYVCDEIITSRAGVRVRVVNTDAEGRMAMCDVLCRMKELCVLDNGPAKKVQTACKLQCAGDEVGDPLEISTLRREDYDFVGPESVYEDVRQCNDLPSSRTPRGHQFPAAFMIRASGLDKFGIDAENPIRYTHFDIAGSAGLSPRVIPTAAPLPALAQRYLRDRS